ncbi:MAG: hypothetical protein A2V70_01200 [Planctomycetes bacterium RBG_13_63_9]|nr:MAG: hypothetical protein A2V70_01200 [Planctomycetes bacterium RBG_13_63_9]
MTWKTTAVGAVVAAFWGWQCSRPADPVVVLIALLFAVWWLLGMLEHDPHWLDWINFVAVWTYLVVATARLALGVLQSTGS